MIRTVCVASVRDEHGQAEGMEVRAHEVPILLEDEQTVGRLVYHKMADVPNKLYGQAIGSSYQQQGLALPKQFKTTPSVELAATP